MAMKESELSKALAVSDTSKDRVVKAKIPADASNGATEYVVDSCANGVLSLSKAPSTHA
jgi:hypothetical protein